MNVGRRRSWLLGLCVLVGCGGAGTSDEGSSTTTGDSSSETSSGTTSGGATSGGAKSGGATSGGITTGGTMPDPDGSTSGTSDTGPATETGETGGTSDSGESSESSSGEACIDGDGDGAGVGCGMDDCDDTNPNEASGCLFVSPTGDDMGAGTRADPWRTFDRAFDVLAPGGSLIALDGDYEIVEHGPGSVTCPFDLDLGAAGMEIVIRADNERQATLDFVSWTDCEHVRFEGFVVDDMDVTGVSSFDVRDVLLSPGGLSIADSNEVLVEDSEIYASTAIFVSQGGGVTVRSSYLRGVGTMEGHGVWSINSPVLTVENVIIENFWFGLRLQGSAFGFEQTATAVLGTVISNTGVGIFGESSGTPAGFDDPLFENVLVLDTTGQGIELESVNDATLDGVTVIGAGGIGVELQRDDPGSCVMPGCSGIVRNTFVGSAGGAGISLATGALYQAEYCNVDPAGVVGPAYETSDGDPADGLFPVANSTSVPVPDVGAPLAQCPLAIPAGSPLEGAGVGGADIGANLTERYVDRMPTGESMWTDALEFPCGVQVAGINDGPQACHDVHERLGMLGPCAFIGMP